MDEFFGIYRAGSFGVTVETPRPPSEYTAIQVTFSQDEQILVTKDANSPGITIRSTDILIELTPEETLLFQPSVPSPMGRPSGGPAVMQLRAWASSTDAPASPCWGIPVFDCNSEEALNT